MRFIIIIVIAALLLITTLKTSSASAANEKKLELSIDVNPDPDSSYVIMDSLNSYKIRPDTNLSLPVFIYRGVTLKRTVYVWIQDSEGVKISSKAKFSLPTRFQSYNLTANLSFSGCHPDGKYFLVAEGLDINYNQSVQLFFEGCADEQDFSEVSEDKISFEIAEHPEKVISGTPFSARIVMHNPTDQDLEIIAWSYVYKGSKSISGERELNRKIVNFPSFSNVTFDLTNTATAAEGNYSLKINLLRSDRKTPKEFTFPIIITGDDGEDAEKIDENVLMTSPGKLTAPITATKRKIVSSNISGNRSGVIFQSSSAKARNLTVYFLIAVLVLVLVALIFKRL